MVSFFRIAILTVIVLSMAAPMQAKGPFHGKWWQTDQIVSQLELTENEVQQLEASYETAHVRMIELRGDLETAQLALRMLMEQPELDDAAITTQRQKEKDARARISDERFAFWLEVRKMIGHDRFKQLMEIRDAQRRQRYKKTDEKTGKGE